MHRLMMMTVAIMIAGCAREQGLELPAATVRPTINAGLMLPPTRAETDFAVRTFARAGTTETEVAGTDCVLDSAYFTARFTAPARVALPDLGPQSPVVSIACAGEPGRGTTAIRARLANNDLSPYVGVSVGTGRRSGVGVSLGGIFDVGRRQRPALYPDARVFLTP